MKMQTLIVEPDKIVRKDIKKLLVNLCHKDVVLVGETDNAEDALHIISRQRPNLVFSETSLKQNALSDDTSRKVSAFEVYSVFPPPVPFQLIFVTDDSKAAIPAFELGATGFIPKPISPLLLTNYVSRAKSQWLTEEKCKAAARFSEELVGLTVLPSKMLRFVHFQDIICVKAHRYQSVVELANGEKIQVAQSIRYLAEILKACCIPNGNFLKPNPSFLVNRRHFKRFFTKISYLEMNNGTLVKVLKNK